MQVCCLIINVLSYRCRKTVNPLEKKTFFKAISRTIITFEQHKRKGSAKRKSLLTWGLIKGVLGVSTICGHTVNMCESSISTAIKIHHLSLNLTIQCDNSCRAMCGVTTNYHYAHPCGKSVIPGCFPPTLSCINFLITIMYYCYHVAFTRAPQYIPTILCKLTKEQTDEGANTFHLICDHLHIENFVIVAAVLYPNPTLSGGAPMKDFDFEQVKNLLTFIKQ